MQKYCKFEQFKKVIGNLIPVHSQSKEGTTYALRGRLVTGQSYVDFSYAWLSYVSISYVAISYAWLNYACIISLCGDYIT